MVRRRAYRIDYSPEAVDHMESLTARQSATVLDVVARGLSHEPTVPTRQRKVYARMWWHRGSFASGTSGYTTR